MKKSFELEDSFRSLNHIPRSEIQKRKTYNTILQASKNPKRYRYIFSHWTGVFLTFAMILACTAFLLVQVLNPAYGEQTAAKPAELLTASDIVVTYMTKSVSGDIFSLQSNLTRKGVSIIDDPVWMKTMNDAVNSRKAETNAPVMGDSYDLLLFYDNRKPDKCKLWVHNGEVYLKRIKETKVYKIDSGKSVFVTNLIDKIEKQAAF
ncbi:hypothetical protein [Mesobacillus subterraneus]|uniref:Uncharacterized protein n=1 Tax=Mesobacillus subterraneus TaxID=285983 RepID=A0A427TUX4_9BACI|nr:hypothetical protein [Mesobacillus subterraneus]RSD28270.1 hypothetical protein EJA10_07400 [Mesobacillus subterraneus]